MWSEFVPQYAHLRAQPTGLPFSIGGILQPGKYPQRANNQDAIGIDVDRHAIVAFISDGCASGSPLGKNEKSINEVGANIAIIIAVGTARRLLKEQGLMEQSDAFAKGFSERYLKSLWHLACHLAQSRVFGRKMREHIVFEFLMSTLLGIIVTKGRYLVLGRGDGIIALNGELTCRTADAGSYPLNDVIVHVKQGRAPSFNGGIACIAAGRCHDLTHAMLATDGFNDFPAKEQLNAMAAKPQPGKPGGYDRHFFKEFRTEVAMNIDDEGFHDDRSLVLLRRTSPEAGPNKGERECSR